MRDKISEIQKKLHLKFNDLSYIKLALTHKSYDILNNNERLEFLGDAILNLYVSEKLIHSYPELSEGKLTRFKATIVSRQNLNLVAEKLRLSDFIKIGKGERLDGNSILGNTLEAIIGAIFLDSDYPNTKEILQKWRDANLECHRLRSISIRPRQRVNIHRKIENFYY